MPRPGALANGERPALQSVTDRARHHRRAWPTTASSSLSELARRVGIAKSTAHRTCSVLAGRGLLTRTPAGTYRLGLRFVEYGQLATVRSAVGDRALPLLVELRNALGETVQIGVPAGADVVYVERVEGVHALRYIDGNSAAGAGPPFERRQGARRVHPRSARSPAARRASRRAPATRSSCPTCSAELATIRKRGYARSVDETELGMSSLAVPIRAHVEGPVVAAISMVGPTARIAGSAESRHVATLTAAARQLTASLASGEYRLSSRRRR